MLNYASVIWSPLICGGTLGLSILGYIEENNNVQLKRNYNARYKISD